jgi:hypothetical protein
LPGHDMHTGCRAAWARRERSSAAQQVEGRPCCHLTERAHANRRSPLLPSPNRGKRQPGLPLPCTSRPWPCRHVVGS